MATLKREELYADVSTRPATTIAAELGLPRNTLKRICAGQFTPAAYATLRTQGAPLATVA